METYQEWKKRRTEEGTIGQRTTAPSSSWSSKKRTETGVETYTAWKERRAAEGTLPDYKRRIFENTAYNRQNQLFDYLDRASAFYRSAEDDFDSTTWGNAADRFKTRRTDALNLRDEGLQLQRWMQDNKDYLDPEMYDQVYSHLMDINGGYMDVVSNFRKNADFYGQFDTEEDYLKWDAYSTTEKRQAAYQQNLERLDELTKRRDELKPSEDQPGNPYTTGGGPARTGMPYGAGNLYLNPVAEPGPAKTRDSSAADTPYGAMLQYREEEQKTPEQLELEEIEREIARLQLDINNYKRGNTYDGIYYGSKVDDDYSVYLSDPNYGKYSASDFSNPTPEDLIPQEDWTGNPYTTGGGPAKNGMPYGGGNMYLNQAAEPGPAKTRDTGTAGTPYGAMLQYRDEEQNTSGNEDDLDLWNQITDPLGLYLQSSPDQRAIIQDNGNGQIGPVAQLYRDGTYGNWDQLDEEEIGIYYTILGSQGKDAALKYLSDMQVELNRRGMWEQNELYKQTFDEASGGKRAVLSALTVPANLMGGALGFVADTASTASGGEINPYSAAHGLSNYSQQIRQYQAAAFDESSSWKIPFINFSAGDLYQAGMSTADMFGGAIFGPKAYGVLMGMGASTAEAKRLYEMGASSEQIALGAGLAGAAEMVFETYSMDKLIHPKSADTLRKMIKNALIQGGIEASEEGATEIANLLTNNIIMTSESDWAKLLEEHNGSEYQAFIAAAGRVGSASMAGFVAGFLGGGGSSIRNYTGNYYNDARTGQAINDAEGLEKLREIADDQAKKRSELAQKDRTAKQEQRDLNRWSENANKKHKLFDELRRNRATGMLYKAVQQSVDSDNVADIASALQEQGISEKKAKAIAKAFYNQVTEQRVTPQQAQLIREYGEDSKVQKVIADKLFDIESTIFQRNKALREFEFDVITNQIRQQNAEQTGETGENTAEAVDDLDTTYEFSEDGKAHLKSAPDQAVDIVGFESINNGKVRLRTSDGQVVDASDVLHASEADAIVFETIANMGIKASSANKLLEGFRENQGADAEAYARGLLGAFEYGKANRNTSSMSFSSALTPAQLDYVYRQGRKAAKKHTGREQARVIQTVERARAVIDQRGDAANAEYTVILEDGLTEEEMTPSQKASYEMIRHIPAAMKGNVRIYDGKTGEFGYYDSKSGDIYLNINSTRSQKSMMAFTMGHELVHRAKDGSPAKYRKFADYLIEQYGKQGSDVDAMIAEQKLAAKDHGLELTDEQAFDEVVADACQRMLLDTNAGQRLAEFGAQSKQNQSIVQDVIQWIRDILEKLRSIFADVDPDSLAAQEFAKFDGSVKQILADMYVDMTIDAGENLSTIKAAAGTVVMSEGQPLYSLPKVESIKPSEEKITSNIQAVAGMQSVYDVDGSKLEKSGKKLIDIFEEQFSSWGYNIHSDTFGDIAAKNSSIRSDLRHGFTPVKIASIEAIPTVIKSGKIVGWIEKNNGTLFRIVVAAPITIGKTPYIMGVMLQRDSQHQRLYLHDVVIEKEASDFSQDDLVSTGSSESENLFMTSILQKVLDVKQKTVPKQENKLPVGEDTSPRALLTNALDSVITDPVEKQKLQEYRENIEKLNEQEAKLRDLKSQIKDLSFAPGPRDTQKIKDLREEAAKTENRINLYDKRLLRFEASSTLQKVLQREREKARKKQKQEVAAAVDNQRTRYNQRILRNKIKHVVGELDHMLRTDSKKKHVPDSLKKAVAEALAIENMDTVQADAKIAKYESLIANETDQNKIDAYMLAIERLRKSGNRLKELRDAYEEIRQSTDPDIAMSYDPDLAGHLNEVTQTIGNTSLNKMSVEQLSDLYDMYRAVLTRVRDSNKMHDKNIKEQSAKLSNDVISEVRAEGTHNRRSTKIREALASFSWNNEKPVYAFERLGSKTLSKLYWNIRKGMDTWAVDMMEADEFRLSMYDKYHRKGWDMDKLYKFQSSTGLEFSLNLEQIMSLYAYSKRAQAHDHLLKGGIVFDADTKITEIKNGIRRTYLVDDATTYKISDETLADIVATLNTDQKAFVDEMQNYLSTTMGNKGNQVSMKMYGIKLFKEQYYFPLRSAGQFTERAREADLRREQGQTSLSNSGFTHSTVQNASNPVILSTFMDAWSSHVNDMSNYHAFVLPLDDFRRVYNYKTANIEGQDSVSVYQAIQNAHGKAATAYIDQLYRDLNGGVVADPRENIAKKMIGLFKQGAVMASASVVIQQPSSIARAFAIINPKYFGVLPITRGVGRLLTDKVHHQHQQLWEELKKFAPVAMIKQMGYFDTGMGRSAVDFLQTEEYHGFGEKAKGFFTDSDYRGEVLSKAAAKADELTWIQIWNAVKNETADRNPGMNRNSEEFLKIAGERFSEVIDRTQVYDSVFARSGNMRSKSVFMNIATAFMAEPTTSINMIEDAIRKFGKGYKGQAARTIVAVFLNVLLNSALVSLVYAGRDDDEDETYLEKYVSSFVTESMDGLNPMTYYPFLKDVWSILQGYDVERADMSMVTDVVDVMKNLVKLHGKDTSDMDEEELAEHNKQIRDAWLKALDGMTAFMGLPVKNVRRDFNGAINMYKTLSADFGGRTTTIRSLGDVLQSDVSRTIPVLGWLPQEKKEDKLFDALVAGDTAYVERLKSTYKDEKAYQSAIRSVIGDRFVNGKIGANKASRYLVLYGGLDASQARGYIEKWTMEIDVGIVYDDLRKQFVDKKVTESEAVDYLVKYGGKREEDAEKAVREWGLERDTGIPYSKMKEVFLDKGISEDEAIEYMIEYGGKRRDAAEETVNKWQLELETGIAYEDMKTKFIDEDISESEAVDYMVEYGGKKQKDAEAIVKQWTFEKDTGIAYDDMKTAFFDKKITESEAIKYRVEYGGAKQKDAEKTVSLWKFESENGWAYENRKSLYLDGEISAATLKKALIEFGEYDPEDADLQVQAYDWESEGYENVGTGMVDAYNKYCATLRVPRDVYLHIRRFSSQTENDIGSDGEPIRYSAVKKIMREINAQRGLSDAQKTAIARSFGWSERTIRKYKLW